MTSDSICNDEDMTQNNIFSDIINIDCIEYVKAMYKVKTLIVLPVVFLIGIQIPQKTTV